MCDTCMEYKHPLIHMYNQVRNDRNIEIQFWLASSTVTCIYQLLFKSKQASQWTYVLRFKLDLIFYLCFLKDKNISCEDSVSRHNLPSKKYIPSVWNTCTKSLFEILLRYYLLRVNSFFWHKTIRIILLWQMELFMWSPSAAATCIKVNNSWSITQNPMCYRLTDKQQYRCMEQTVLEHKEEFLRPKYFAEEQRF